MIPKFGDRVIIVPWDGCDLFLIDFLEGQEGIVTGFVNHLDEVYYEVSFLYDATYNFPAQALQLVERKAL